MTFVRDDRFVTAMRADKKIIAKIDGTTKNSFLDGIIGNVSDLASIINSTIEIESRENLAAYRLPTGKPSKNI